MLLAACAETVAPGSPVAPSNISSLELTVSRASLYSTDFEHYKLEGSNLFYECGELQRNRFIARMQEIEKPAEDLSAAVQVAASDLLTVKDTTAYTLPAPGKNAHLADPGILTLVVTGDGGRKEEFKTSLDDTLSGSSKLLDRLLEVSRRLRGLPSNPPCNSKVFYGMKPLK